MDFIQVPKLERLCSRYGYQLPQNGHENPLCPGRNTYWQFVDGRLWLLRPPPEDRPRNSAGEPGDYCFAWVRCDGWKRWREVEAGALHRALWEVSGFARRQLLRLPFAGDDTPRVYIQPHLRSPWSEKESLIGSFDLAWACPTGRRVWHGENFLQEPDDIMQLAEAAVMQRLPALDLLQAVTEYSSDHPDLRKLWRLLEGFAAGAVA